MASLDGRSLFVGPENPENDLKIISIDRELDRWGGVGFGATLAKTSCREMLLTFITRLETVTRVRARRARDGVVRGGAPVGDTSPAPTEVPSRGARPRAELVADADRAFARARPLRRCG